jgi:hypothetical protein
MCKDDNIDFAPNDYTDGRKPLDWKSRYQEKEAKRCIILETIYLTIILFLIPIIILLFWLKIPNYLFKLEEAKYHLLTYFVYSWLGGSLGGALYSIKWLYHSVAKSIWHLDRLIWRIMTPHLSGALGFIFMVIMYSNIIKVFNKDFISSGWIFLSISFMVGYFSDNAVAKLAEIARTLFGVTEKHKSL